MPVLRALLQREHQRALLWLGNNIYSDIWIAVIIQAMWEFLPCTHWTLSKFLRLIQKGSSCISCSEFSCPLLLDAGDGKEQAVLELLHLLYLWWVSQCPGYLVSLILSYSCGTEIGLDCPAKVFPVHAVKQYSFVEELQNHFNGAGIATKPNS